MICLLSGHSFSRFPGHGEYDGKSFDICVECGKTVEVNDPQGVERAANGAFFDDLTGVRHAS